MNVVCDIETNGLENPDEIWCVVCRDVQTNAVYEFVHPTGTSPASLAAKKSFLDFSKKVNIWVGHHFINFDAPILRSLLGLEIDNDSIIDTLVVSRLLHYERDGGHSLAALGESLGVLKLHQDIEDWSVVTPEMVERCVSDTAVTLALYNDFLPYITSPQWAKAMEVEHFMAAFCGVMSANGFAFDKVKAEALLGQIQDEIDSLDTLLRKSFRPKVVKVSEVLPKETKFGTLSKVGFKFLGPNPDLREYTPGAGFSRIEYREFNPGSVKQIVERLNDAGWKPTEKTKGHKAAEKALQKLSRKRYRGSQNPEITALRARLVDYGVYGWTVSEENLETLPPDAPESARKLAYRLKLGNRASTLESWVKLVRPDGAIHGTFNPIGTWTHRMSHDRPNMGNVPKMDYKNPEKTPYSDVMRSLWIARPGRKLVGVDAESIQLRIFAHYIDDPDFTSAMVSGDKKKGTDPHTMNMKALGSVCKSRDVAKTFIYAWLLGAGIPKIAGVLECTRTEAEEAVNSFIERYPGLKYLRDHVIPEDAARGYFKGLDGRYVTIRGDTESSRAHFALAGYLQNGEAVVMKRAAMIWYPRLLREGVPIWPVNLVHDENQTEVGGDLNTAQYVASVQAEAIAKAGEDLQLRCPLAGSIYNSHDKLAIGDSWLETH